MTSTPESENPHQAAEDLALIRSMMAAGRRRAGVDGTHLMLWGALLMIAFFLQYASVVGRLPPMQNMIWWPIIIIGWVCSHLIARHGTRCSMENNLALTGYAAAWTAVGITMVLHLLAVTLSENFDPRATTMLSTGVIGAAFFVIARVVKVKPLFLVAAGWWALMVYVSQMSDYDAEMLLVMAGACGSLILVPGLFLRRLANSEG